MPQHLGSAVRVQDACQTIFRRLYYPRLISFGFGPLSILISAAPVYQSWRTVFQANVS